MSLDSQVGISAAKVGVVEYARLFLRQVGMTWDVKKKPVALSKWQRLLKSRALGHGGTYGVCEGCKCREVWGQLFRVF